ncbi:WD40-repeat-containing domain protein [Leucosporidium creatinivorum]|uniref:Glutamate-rich WD repeat-containing protein 1 n=1 Tax=Leucosporidium creatinivorum TaxID=106004 RepID=A0A1Y2G4T6_9BASI|nr:WD40-repeat-containing domain protein [Leucosporidium creatinivorum]
MGKRASSPTGNSASKQATAPAEGDRTKLDDEGMGEFEDQWEDEFEADADAGEVIDAAEHEDEDGEGGDGEMEVDDEPEPLEEEERAASPIPYLPGGALEEGETLQPDMTTYPLLHNFVPTWPSLSFDILRDNLGEERRGYPVSCSLVSGTQSMDRTANEITVMRWEGLGKTRKDENDLDDDEDDSDDEAEDDPILTFRAIPHQGCVNRIRARILPEPLSQGPPTAPDRYEVATFSETGKVHIFDVAPQLQSLLNPGAANAPLSKLPLYTVDAHGRAEGYALAWGNPIGTSTSARLLSGDIHSKIFLTTMGPSSFTTSPKPFLSHTDSVEDLQWSPSEPTVFASCSADKSVRVWDIRVKDRKSVIGVAGAHDSDVNVISWNLKTNYLLASGGDEGGIKVWDLRNFKGTKAPAPTPVASFNWHTAPITSIEWHPTEDSCFAASGADDQVTLWDLSVEEDDDEKPSQQPGEAERLKDVPSQLLFVHQGQKDIKEVHWHPQIPGVVVSTALDGFNIFKSLPFA